MAYRAATHWLTRAAALEGGGTVAHHRHTTANCGHPQALLLTSQPSPSVPLSSSVPLRHTPTLKPCLIPSRGTSVSDPLRSCCISASFSSCGPSSAFPQSQHKTSSPCPLSQCLNAGARLSCLALEVKGPMHLPVAGLHGRHASLGRHTHVPAAVPRGGVVGTPGPHPGVARRLSGGAMHSGDPSLSPSVTREAGPSAARAGLGVPRAEVSGANQVQGKTQSQAQGKAPGEKAPRGKSRERERPEASGPARDKRADVTRDKRADVTRDKRPEGGLSLGSLDYYLSRPPPKNSTLKPPRHRPRPFQGQGQGQEQEQGEEQGQGQGEGKGQRLRHDKGNRQRQSQEREEGQGLGQGQKGGQGAPKNRAQREAGAQVEGPEFAEMGLPQGLVSILRSQGFLRGTSVQAAAIPTLMQGHDAVIQSYTGSGKTLAYLLPLLLRTAPEGWLPSVGATELSSESTQATGGPLSATPSLETTGVPPSSSAGAVLEGRGSISQGQYQGKGKGEPQGQKGRQQKRQKSGIEAVVVAPSQELAMQIVREAQRILGEDHKSSVQQLIGGANQRRQEEGLKKNKPSVVVGTPGRIAELSRAGKLQTHGCRFLVLDEADALLSHRFRPDMLRILEHVGRQRTRPPTSIDPQLPMYSESQPRTVTNTDPSSDSASTSHSSSASHSTSARSNAVPQEGELHSGASTTVGSNAAPSPDRAPARTERQTVLVSATMTGAVLEAATRWGCAPMLVQCAPQGMLPVRPVTGGGTQPVSVTVPTSVTVSGGVLASQDQEFVGGQVPVAGEGSYEGVERGEGEVEREGGWGGLEGEVGEEREEEEEALRRSLNSAGASLSPSLKHYFVVVNARHKVDALRRCLVATGAGSAMVFMNFPKRLQDVQHKLEARGVPSAMLHGQMQKMARAGVLNSFRTGKMRVLLLSDVGARGLDVMDCDLVVNLELPSGPAHYAHRAGRTGRLGQRGTVVSVCEESEVFVMAKLQRQLGVPFIRAEFVGGELLPYEGRRKV